MDAFLDLAGSAVDFRLAPLYRQPALQLRLHIKSSLRQIISTPVLDSTMSENDERTPLLSGMRRSATSSAQTDAASQTSQDPSLRVERRQTWPATRSFFSSAKDSVVSACQAVASTLLPPTPTKEELDEVLSGWSELGQEELNSQLVFQTSLLAV